MGLRMTAKDFINLTNYACTRTLYIMLLKNNMPVLHTDVKENRGFREHTVQLIAEIPDTYSGLKYKLYEELDA